jgi:anaerobic magnesium-protoporphyrin IX monomethyl ester cyclase
MRVLLINPGTECNPRFKTYAVFPNGLLFLAAVLEREGHEVQIFDNVVDGSEPAEIIENFKPQLIGYSVLTGTDITQAIAQSEEFKRLLPKVPIVWGNVHPSTTPDQTIKEDFVDFIIIGAGEVPLVQLVKHLEEGKPELSEIDGLVYIKDEQILINEPKSELVNLDELPDPAWHLIDVKKYWAASLNTSRGCPFKCTFCYNSAFHSKYRGDFSAKRIISQVQYLQDTYGIKFIRFFEDNFTFNRKRLREFCQLVIDNKIKFKWDCEARADLSEDDIRLMEKAGCTAVGLGVESGSPRILDFLKKGVDLEQMQETFWRMVKHHIIPRIYIMGALPTETVDDFNQTKTLLKKMDNPPYIYMRYVPYAGTPLFQYCVDHKLIDPPMTLREWPDFAYHSAIKANISEIPDDMVNNSFAEYARDYPIRRVRFMIRHNPAFFLQVFTNPREFFSQVKELVKNSLPILFNKNSSSAK